MGKGRFFGSVAVAAAICWATLGGGGGCGQSNDQGISFRAVGWFQEGDGSEGDTGQASPLACSPPLTSFIGLQNNMVQGIFVERVDLSYRVSGSQLSIPNHSEAVSSRLGPASGQEPQNPPNQFLEVFVVPSTVIEFLNNNRNQLPEPPFAMVVTATAVGITDSGDEFRTNRIGYQVDWLGDEFCEEEEAPAPEE